MLLKNLRGRRSVHARNVHVGGGRGGVVGVGVDDEDNPVAPRHKTFEADDSYCCQVRPTAFGPLCPRQLQQRVTQRMLNEPTSDRNKRIHSHCVLYESRSDSARQIRLCFTRYAFINCLDTFCEILALICHCVKQSKHDNCEDNR
jgi:hypothetical protein